jgi:hypothetical protein
LIHRDTQRTYRSALSPRQGECRFQVTVEESDLLVAAASDLSVDIAAYLRLIRGQLKNYILLNPEFKTSLTPLPAGPDAPEIARRMLEAASSCQVGPMAAVAGTIAQMVADRFAPLSPDILVENGGDIYLHSTRERLVALLAKPVQGARLALRIAQCEFPLALCTSSATIGHSLSFGAADLVTVKARSGALADAAATTLGNLARSADHLPLVLKRAEELAKAGVLGVFVQVGEAMGAWGEMELAVLE